MDTENNKIRQNKKSFNYLFVMIPLCCLMVLVALGFCSSQKGLFITPITDAYEYITRASYSLGDTARYISTALVNIFFGTLIYKFGAKKLILFGFLSLTASMLVCALSTNVFFFWVGGALLGIGLSFTTTTMVGAVVNKWCKKNKGTIMGIVLASNGIGGAIAAQVLTPLVAKSPLYYKNAYMIIACILVAVAMLVLMLFRNQPDKNAPKEAKQEKAKKDYGAILSTGYLYPAAICIFITGMVLQSIHGITTPIYKDLNMESALMANVLSVSSLMLFFTKFGVGFIYDRIGLRGTTIVCFASAIISTALLAIVAITGNTALAFVYSVFSAFALPLETIMLPIYAREFFGEKRFNAALGIFVSVNTAGYAVGAPLANLCYDITKDLDLPKEISGYNIWLYLSGALMIITVVAINIVISVSKKKLRQLQAMEAINNGESV